MSRRPTYIFILPFYPNPYNTPPFIPIPTIPILPPFYPNPYNIPFYPNPYNIPILSQSLQYSHVIPIHTIPPCYPNPYNIPILSQSLQYYAGMHLCSYASIQVCTYAVMQLCRLKEFRPPLPANVLYISIPASHTALFLMSTVIYSL